MEIIFTKDPEWLEKWDAFIVNEDKASHLLLSDWIASYAAYGFENEFCICHDNGKIIGGYAAVIAKVLFFRFYTVPYGPVAIKGFEDKIDELIVTVPQRGKKWRAAYAHIALPVSDVENQHVYKEFPLQLNNVKTGHLFKFIYVSNGLNWIDLKNFPDEDALLESFKSSVRRDIRSSLRKGMSVKILQTESELKAGYDLCLQNASKNSYALRDWNSFRQTLVNLTEKGMAKFIAAYKDDDLKGAVLLVKAGNFYTYILGGSKKEKPDLLAGHFLQWEAIKLSMAEGFDGYNISLGGSKGVTEFKGSFNTRQILFTGSKYHWVLKPALFKSYLFFEKRLKPHKQFISKMLSAFSKKK